ncbi:MAG: HEAT repeat domain-containing protein [Candidatus Riflebacteria bacterium]|nr:HEAT repeat domain-containing protein [Candidatus Riflebacteria bacterium]
MPDRISEIINRLGSIDPEERSRALQELFRDPFLLSNDGITSLVTKMLRDSDEGVRFWARRLNHSFFEERNKSKREAKICFSENLADISSPEQILQLFEKLKTLSDSPMLAIEVIAKILEFKEPSVVDPLLKLLGSFKDPILISFLVKHLPITFPKINLENALIPYLQHSDNRVIANAIEGLEAIGGTNSIALFAQLLKHSSPRVRANAAKALGRSNPELSFQIFSKMLEYKQKPHFIIAALHAIKQLNNFDFLPKLFEFFSDPVVGNDAIEAFAHLHLNQLVKRIEAISNPEVAEKTKKILVAQTGGKILNWMQEKKTSFLAIPSVCQRLLKEISHFENPPSGLKAPKIKLQIEEQKIVYFKEVISLDESKRIAEENKKRGFNFFSRFLKSSKTHEIKTVSSKTRFEPFWVLQCHARTEFHKISEFKIPTEKNAREIFIAAKGFDAKNGYSSVPFVEFCVSEKTFDLQLDARSGEKVDWLYQNKFPSFEIPEISELSRLGKWALYPKLRASTLLRNLLSDIFDPIIADEILKQEVHIKKLNLFFRPIHVFEFQWNSDFASIFINGLTGEFETRQIISPQSEGIIQSDDWFDVTAEAIGMVIPGGTIAAKLARAVLKK